MTEPPLLPSRKLKTTQKRVLAKIRKQADGEVLTDLPLFPGAVIHIGARCAWTGKDLGHNLAHAHASTKIQCRGLICIRRKYFDEKNGRDGFSLMVWHEWAHICVPGGHTARWRQAMIDLGFPEEAERMRVRYPSSRRATDAEKP